MLFLKPSCCHPQQIPNGKPYIKPHRVSTTFDRLNIMTRHNLEDAEKIARMTEWNEHEPWEYSDNDEHSEENNLAAAKRFLAAQSFLLSWQEGKVPTGWRRARRINDFDSEYPPSVVEAAEDIIADRIAERNLEKTVRLNAALKNRGLAKTNGEAKDDDAMSKAQIEKLKSDFSAFSHEFYQAKSALAKATSAIADVSFRIQALSEILQ